MKEQTCFFTGHRDIPPAELIQIRNNTYMLCRGLVEKMNIRRFVCGGALGFDMLAAQVVLRLKEQYPSVTLHLVLPCKDQASRWSVRAQQNYRLILSSADSVEYVSEQYTPTCMHQRNRAMVDMSCCGIAFLRHMSGGTAYTVKYATGQDVKVYFVDRVAQKEK